MALENRSPAFRKNVMAAAVSAAAMPALAGTTAAIVSTAVAAAGTVGIGNQLLSVNDPKVLGGLFLSHWFVTNYFLQKFPADDEKAVGE